MAKDRVKAKKNLGQHFLKDAAIAHRIVSAVNPQSVNGQVLEVGPGMGVLTSIMLDNPGVSLKVVELDTESVAYLQRHYEQLAGRIINQDFLQLNFEQVFEGKFGIVGNFPYNISSQIFFKVYENRHLVTEVVGMVQKEVGERIAAGPKGRTNGILSILLQAFYQVEVLFQVPPHVFDPPPKVTSVVVRLKRNEREQLSCDEQLFKKVVKQAYSMRRKTLRNALKPLGLPSEYLSAKQFDRRAEELSVENYIALTKEIATLKNT